MPEFSQQAKQIFNEARKLLPEQRLAHLDTACAGDADLRAQVEDLLVAYSAAGSFLEAPTFAPADRVGPDSKTRSAEEAPGTVIGRYKLLQPIGEGGFGRVFMAEQTEPVVRKVALKIIKLGMDTRQVIARFEAERQALAMMDHPNIAKVLDAGATPEGRPFFVMELVRGEPITEYCDKNNLSVPERLELFSAVCNAVQHAHQKGIIHRDIKPNNVLVTLADGKPVPKVIDFGIAKATSARLTEKTLFTEFRHLIGTPAYMSPEQAEASGVDIDTRSDIYSLGVLLYELLTGTTPFDAKRLHSAAYGEIQRIIREEEPPKPSTRLSTLETLPAVAAQRHTEPAKLSRTIRGDLDWIVMKCLEKDRTRRYETANALAQEIERHLNDEPVLAGPPSAGYRVRKFVRRHRVGVLATAAVAAALVLGVLGTTWGMIWATQEAKRAGDEAERARVAEEAERSRTEQLVQVALFQSAVFENIDTERMGIGLRDALIAEAVNALAQSGLSPAEADAAQEQLEAVLGETNPTNAALQVLHDHVLAPALNSVDEQFKDQPQVRAHLLQTLATTLRELGLTQAAVAPQEQALQIRRTHLGSDHLDTLESVLHTAYLLKAQGRLTEAEPCYLESLEGSRRHFGEEDPNTIAALIEMGALFEAQGRLAKAEALYLDALGRSRRNVGDMHEGTLTILVMVAQVARLQGRLADAEGYYREALEGMRQNPASLERDPTVAATALIMVLRAQRKWTEAEQLLKEQLDARRRILGDNHPGTLETIGVIGNVLYEQHRPREAEPFAREALAGMRLVLGDTHPTTAIAVANMGAVLAAQGKYADAEPYFREALGARPDALDRSHFDSIDHLGLLLTEHDRVDAAAELLAPAMEQAREKLGDHPITARLEHHYGDALVRLGRIEDAIPLVERAAKRYGEHADWPQDEALHTNWILMCCYSRTGRSDAAMRLAESALERAGAIERHGALAVLVGLALLDPAMAPTERIELAVRECLATRTRVYPDGHLFAWQRYNAAAMLGGVLVAQAEGLADQRDQAGEKLDEAEPLLLEAYERLASDPNVPNDALLTGHDRIALIIERLIRLYELREGLAPGQGHDNSIAQWRERLQERLSPQGRAVPSPKEPEVGSKS